MNDLFDHPFPLVDSIDQEIIMHKDAHFSGSFPIMIEYYEKEGKGVNPDFKIKRIHELEELEIQTGQNLSNLLLSDRERDLVERAKKKYLMFRELYDQKSEIPKLIGDLVLSEKEDPQEEIASVVAKGKQMTQYLLELLASEDFYSPLFPGYGEAPALAARCLGKIGDEAAIPFLFDALGKEDFFTEETLLEALFLMGEKSKRFLLNKLKRHPLTKDNEQAAAALLYFEDDSEISELCLDLLEKNPTLTPSSFNLYLILGCASLREEDKKNRFINIAKRLNLSTELRSEMEEIIEKWDKQF